MKHIVLMVAGCALALLLIYILPAMGLGNAWVVTIVIGAMMLCHLMHFGRYEDKRNGENVHGHRL